MDLPFSDEPFSYRIRCECSRDDPVETLLDAFAELDRIAEEGVCLEEHVIEERRGDEWRVFSVIDD